MDNAKKGRIAANQMTEKVGVPVTFLEFDGTRFHFSSRWYRLYKVIGLDGSTERESSISKKWGASNEYVYYETACYPEQLENGDLEFFIEHHMTQNIHERFSHDN